jgi:hypothetical protein
MTRRVSHRGFEISLDAVFISKGHGITITLFNPLFSLTERLVLRLGHGYKLSSKLKISLIGRANSTAFDVSITIT